MIAIRAARTPRRWPFLLPLTRASSTPLDFVRGVPRRTPATVFDRATFAAINPLPRLARLAFLSNPPPFLLPAPLLFLRFAAAASLSRCLAFLFLLATLRDEVVAHGVVGIDRPVRRVALGPVGFAGLFEELFGMGRKAGESGRQFGVREQAGDRRTSARPAP